MQYSAQWTDITSGPRKFVHRWSPRAQPRAVVCIVHGLGEHGGRYRRLAAEFVQAGFAVLAFDQQGHGQSLEKRGCIDSYQGMLADIDEFLSLAETEFPGLRQVLFGHSMGGNLVLNYAMRHDRLPQAVISSSPMLRAVRAPGWLLEKAARVLLLLAPNFCLRSNIVVERLMSDPIEQEELKNDQLFHSQLSLRLGAALLDSGVWALENATRLGVTTLLTHGTSDYMTSHQASKQFASRAGDNCRLELLDGQLHDPFRDTERDAVIGLYVEFIQQVTEKSTP